MGKHRKLKFTKMDSFIWYSLREFWRNHFIPSRASPKNKKHGLKTREKWREKKEEIRRNALDKNIVIQETILAEISVNRRRMDFEPRKDIRRKKKEKDSRSFEKVGLRKGEDIDGKLRSKRIFPI